MKIVKILESEYEKWDAPAKRFETAYRRTPYTIMLSVLLSFRTKDEVTLEAGRRLFALADTPQKMVQLPKEKIEETIYPVGFYRKKAASILEISAELIEKYDARVPSTEAELLKIRGIGPKAAHIILESAFGEKTVAVDTHVHRILNLWGFVETSTPNETFEVLKERLTPDEQAGLNRLLVSFGQVICKPQRPACNACPVAGLCPAAQPA
ncbi:endonuclease III domain-containing protein [Hydrogenimonas sp.]